MPDRTARFRERRGRRGPGRRGWALQCRARAPVTRHHDTVIGPTVPFSAVSAAAARRLGGSRATVAPGTAPQLTKLKGFPGLMTVGLGGLNQKARGPSLIGSPKPGEKLSPTSGLGALLTSSYLCDFLMSDHGTVLIQKLGGKMDLYYISLYFQCR